MSPNYPTRGQTTPPPDTLIIFEQNPRDNEAAIPHVAASIKRFGFGAPIVARRATRTILAGHTRRAAALLLAEQWAKATSRERAVWRPDGVRVATKGEVAVRFVDLDDHDATLYNIADNLIGEKHSRTDKDKLSALLRQLRAEDVDLVDGTGLNDADVRDLLDDPPTRGEYDPLHPAAFPVGLPEFFIRAFSDEGDAVYDPFLGSGTTLLAAERNGRRSYGMELSPKYCAVILERATTAGLKVRRA